MPNEPIQGLPYPALTGAPPNVPADIKALADAVVGRTVMRFASIAARDAALPSPVDGMLCYVTSDKAYYARSGGQWRLLWRESTSPVVQRGRISVPFSGTTGSLAVVYPVAFDGTPATVCQVLATTTWAVNASATTATGFTATIFRATGTGTGTVSVDWIAAY